MSIFDTPEYAILRLKDQIAGNKAVLAAYRLGPLSERGLRVSRHVEMEKAQLEEELRLLLSTLDNKYDPNQPRVPAGNSDGGQWTDTGGSGGGIGVSPQGNLPDSIAPTDYRPTAGQSTCDISWQQRHARRQCSGKQASWKHMLGVEID
jgi:hypothetical protein